MSDDFVLPDLTNADINTKQVYDPIPYGKYELMVTGSKFKKSKNKGTPSLNVEFTVQSGEYKGRKLWNDFWLTPKAAGMLASFLAIANVRMNGKRIHNENLANLNKQEFLAAVLGSKVIGKVKIEQSDPQYPPQNRFSGFDVHPSNPEPPSKNSDDQLPVDEESVPSAGPDEAPNFTL